MFHYPYPPADGDSRSTCACGSPAIAHHGGVAISVLAIFGTGMFLVTRSGGRIICGASANPLFHRSLVEGYWPFGGIYVDFKLRPLFEEWWLPFGLITVFHFLANLVEVGSRRVS